MLAADPQALCRMRLGKTHWFSWGPSGAQWIFRPHEQLNMCTAASKEMLISFNILKPHLGTSPSAYLTVLFWLFACFFFFFFLRFSPTSCGYLSFLSVPFFLFILVSGFYIRGLPQMLSNVCWAFLYFLFCF